MGDQVDLFLDSLINAPIKDERATMEFPFFSLSKNPRYDPIEYNDGRVHVRVEPGQRGLATIWDKDVLIYCASVINDRLERGAPVDRVLSIAAYDLLRICERGTGKQSYELLLDALVRLRATTIITNIESDGEAERRGFGWIDNFRVREKTLPNGTKRMEALEVHLNDWFLRAIIKERRVLSINRAYFKLKKGIERRLYELARKHCGKQPRWVVRLERLAEKCGTTRDLRRFKSDLKLIIKSDTIPDYQLALVFDTDQRKEIEGTFGPDAGRRYGTNERILVQFTPKGRIDDDSITIADVDNSPYREASCESTRNITDKSPRNITDKGSEYRGQRLGISRTKRAPNPRRLKEDPER